MTNAHRKGQALEALRIPYIYYTSVRSSAQRQPIMITSKNNNRKANPRGKGRSCFQSYLIICSKYSSQQNVIGMQRNWKVWTTQRKKNL
jgi:hypothetical protein